jgi:hypothetical protein
MNLIYRALEARALADIATAEATLQTYLTASVGIGEHPQIVEEAEKQLELLAAAEDRLETLRSRFSPVSGMLIEK